MDINSVFFGLFRDVSVELIRENSHNAVGLLRKPYGLEKTDDTGHGKEVQDIPTDDDPVKAGVMKFDIFGKLVYK